MVRGSLRNVGRWRRNVRVLLGVPRDLRLVRLRDCTQTLERDAREQAGVGSEPANAISGASSEPEQIEPQLLQRERLATLGLLTGTVSHELRNPLAVIRSSVFYVQRKLGNVDERVTKHLDRIEEQVTICDTIIEELLEYTRGRKPYSVAGDVNCWLAGVIEQVGVPNDVALKAELADGLPVVAFDPDKMRRVMDNVVENALQAIEARKGSLGEQAEGYRPQVTIATTEDAGNVLIAVSDNGIGMEPETIRRAFEPLFTTRARGTGLGLAIVKKIVDEHGGSIGLASRPGEGTTVRICLPANPPASSPSPQGHEGRR